jgi:transposase
MRLRNLQVLSAVLYVAEQGCMWPNRAVNGAFSRNVLGAGARLIRMNRWPKNGVVLYKKRTEIERLFRRLKGFRRTSSRFEKPGVLFLGFPNFALIIEALR